MQNKKIRIATVFSGIGAFEQALIKKKINHEIVFACDNGEREIPYSYEEIIDYGKKNKFDNETLNKYVCELYKDSKKENFMKLSYFANYKIQENQWYEDIRFINGKKYHNQVDIFVGGSPCQSFSIIGKRAGLNDVRGTLFYEYARLVKEIKPRVFIYENVCGMLVHDNGNTWNVIIDVFNSLGYKIYWNILNSSNYGIPQNRKRVFVVGFKSDVKDFKFPDPIDLETTMFDYLENDVPARFYLGKKGFEFVINPKYNSRARVNRDIIQTQKANQQFNWNGDFVFVDYEKIKSNEEIMKRAYIGEWNGRRGAIRQLTHRECHRLMGFSDEYKIVVPNVWAYRQAGNSIVVNVLEYLLDEINRVEKIYEEN